MSRPSVQCDSTKRLSASQMIRKRELLSGYLDRWRYRLDELKRRGVKSDYCPRCDTSDWNVDLLRIPANSALSDPLGGQVYPQTIPYSQANGFIPLLGIVCKNCGYSLFHNLNVLGIAE